MPPHRLCRQRAGADSKKKDPTTIAKDLARAIIIYLDARARPAGEPLGNCNNAVTFALQGGARHGDSALQHREEGFVSAEACRVAREGSANALMASQTTLGYIWTTRTFLKGGHMSYNCRRTLFFALTCLLCVAGHVEAGAPSGRGTARLIVYRIPTMGKFVFVQLYVDDVVVGSIAYGQSYEVFLKPGRHVLSALATPRPKWWERPPTIVDMRSGRTYRFTAIGNGAGNLMLWNNEDARPPRLAVRPGPPE